MCNRLKILLVLNLFLDEILGTVLFILNMIKFLGNILLRNLLLPKSNRQRTSFKTIGLELAIYLIRNLKTVLYWGFQVVVNNVYWLKLLFTKLIVFSFFYCCSSTFMLKVNLIFMIISLLFVFWINRKNGMSISMSSFVLIWTLCINLVKFYI